MKCGVNAVMLYCDPTKFELRSTRELQVIDNNHKWTFYTTKV